MKVLKGSEKQIEYANKVREEVINFFQNINSEDEKKFEKLAGGSKTILKSIELIDSAATLIDLDYKDSYKSLGCVLVLDRYFQTKKLEKIAEIKSKEMKLKKKALKEDIENEFDSFSRNWWFKEY